MTVSSFSRRFLPSDSLNEPGLDRIERNAILFARNKARRGANIQSAANRAANATRESFNESRRLQQQATQAALSKFQNIVPQVQDQPLFQAQQEAALNLLNSPANFSQQLQNASLSRRLNATNKLFDRALEQATRQLKGGAKQNQIAQIEKARASALSDAEFQNNLSFAQQRDQEQARRIAVGQPITNLLSQLIASSGAGQANVLAQQQFKPADFTQIIALLDQAARRQGFSGINLSQAVAGLVPGGQAALDATKGLF